MILGSEFLPFPRDNSADIFSNYFPTFFLKYIFERFRLLLICIDLVLNIGLMVRTRRAVICTPSPSSSEEHTPSLHEESPVEDSPSTQSPPRSRWKTASTSREEPLPDYNTTRFTSLENQQ